MFISDSFVIMMRARHEFQVHDHNSFLNDSGDDDLYLVIYLEIYACSNT
jgi:hypothetical protein